MSYRSGDMWAPWVEEVEALQLETRYFLDCVAGGERPFNDGRAGLRVVRMLEAAEESLKRHKEIVKRRELTATFHLANPMQTLFFSPICVLVMCHDKT